MKIVNTSNKTIYFEYNSNTFTINGNIVIVESDEQTVQYEDITDAFDNYGIDKEKL